MSQKQVRNVLFLCTGNYYRSRFAECVFNAAATRMGLPWRATSKGLALERGTNNLGPMATSAVKALKEMGISGGGELTRLPAPVSEDDFAKAAKIVALKEAEHRPLLIERHPEWTEKVEYWTVDDVPGVLPEIETQVNGLIARLLGGRLEAPVIERKEVTAVAISKKILTANVGRETKGRRGKGVTTVFELALNATQMAELATLLKNKIGTGGAVKDGQIEIQGDHRDRVCAELEKLGYKTKRVGG